MEKLVNNILEELDKIQKEIDFIFSKTNEYTNFTNNKTKIEKLKEEIFNNKSDNIFFKLDNLYLIKNTIINNILILKDEKLIEFIKKNMSEAFTQNIRDKIEKINVEEFKKDIYENVNTITDTSATNTKDLKELTNKFINSNKSKYSINFYNHCLKNNNDYTELLKYKIFNVELDTETKINEDKTDSKELHDIQKC